MFIDTKIALISSEDLQASSQLKELGLKETLDLNSEDFKYRPMRFRIDDIKYLYQALEQELIVLELYDTDGQFMLQDKISRLTKCIDDYYAHKP